MEQQEYDNNLTGVLFKNDKGSNPARPDIRGECTVEGKNYNIVGWQKTSAKGNTYYKLKLEPAEAEPSTENDDQGGLFNG